MDSNVYENFFEDTDADTFSHSVANEAGEFVAEWTRVKAGMRPEDITAVIVGGPVPWFFVVTLVGSTVDTELIQLARDAGAYQDEPGTGFPDRVQHRGREFVTEAEPDSGGITYRLIEVGVADGRVEVRVPGTYEAGGFVPAPFTAVGVSSPSETAVPWPVWGRFVRAVWQTGHITGDMSHYEWTSGP